MSPSRREFLLATGTIALGAIVGRPRLLDAIQGQGQPQPVFTPLRRNVGFFTMQGGTVGWLVSPGGVVVVDTQFPAPARVLLEGLQSRSGNRGVDLLINTHHHGDHTGGNGVFRGVARRVVAHTVADMHYRRLPGGQPPPAAQGDAPEPLYPDTTFTHAWSAEVGDERITARHHGRAHTSGDAVITFEHANVVHMGDLMFHRRHPVVDRAAGASLRNWIRVLENTASSHAADTIYIFGHAAAGQAVTGSSADLLAFRDYLGALLSFVEEQLAAGKPRDEVLAMRDPLRGFESWGRFGQTGARDPLTVAWEELTSGQ
jgi:cyclase